MNAVTIIRTPEKLGLRVEDYLRLARAGAYDGYGKTELIEGDVYAMNAQYSRHARIKTVALSDDSMPEPDISVTSYQGNDPTPASSIALIVEVADTTLAIDLGRKAALYARHGIPEYWVLDVDAGIIHQMWEPGNAGFAQVRRAPFGNLLMAATLDNLTIATTDF
jgi:hypothetical protein